MTVIFEPQFYERRALHHFAKTREVNLLINCRVPEAGVPLMRQVEIDGLVRTDGPAIAIEVKSTRLDERDVAAIRAWYRDVGFCNTVVIAPDFTADAIRKHRPHARCELLAYRPNEDAIFRWYEAWRPGWPSWVAAAIASGRHHFRYVLTRASLRGGRVVNQIAKRIYDCDGVIRDLLRLPHPPARVYWSPQRWSTPKDVYRRETGPLALGGLGVLDIDGTPLHAAMHACEIGPRSSRCDHCRRRSLGEARTAVRLWPNSSPALSGVIDSGNRGLHMYFRASHADMMKAAAIQLAAAGVRLDFGASASRRAVVGLPGSLYAATMEQQREVSIDA